MTQTTIPLEEPAHPTDLFGVSINVGNHIGIIRSLYRKQVLKTAKVINITKKTATKEVYKNKYISTAINDRVSLPKEIVEADLGNFIKVIETYFSLQCEDLETGKVFSTPRTDKIVVSAFKA